MDDNSERKLIFVPSNKGGSHSLLSSVFLRTNSDSISIFISIEFLLKSLLICYLPTTIILLF